MIATVINKLSYAGGFHMASDTSETKHDVILISDNKNLVKKFSSMNKKNSRLLLYGICQFTTYLCFKKYWQPNQFPRSAYS